MGLNLKGKSWAGIYHQIESLCQDVDDYMSQGTVKLVENQMQNVGINVKRFYSNVVQDILPRFEDIESTESQSVDGEQVDTLGRVNSITDIRRNPTCNNEKQLSAEQVSVDTVRNSDASLQIEIKPLHADSFQESETCQNLGENSEAVIWNEIFNGSSDEFDENSTLTSSSPAFSSREGGNIVIEKEKEGLFNQQNLLDEAECVSNISSSRLLFDSKLPMASVHKVNEEDNSVDSSLASAPDVADGAFGKDGTLSHSFSTKDEGFDSSSSVQSPVFVCSHFSFIDDEEEEEYDDEEEEEYHEEEQEDVEEVDKEEVEEQEQEQDVQEKEEEEEEEEMGITNSTYSTMTKCSFNLYSTFAATAPKAEENISLFDGEPNDFDYEMKVEDLLPASLLLELNGGNAFPTDVQDSVLSSSEMRHEESYNGQSETAIIPSETGNSCDFGVGIDDHNMETVDLSPDMKRDARSVGLNINLVPAASHRSKDFSYYKKLIQGAFTSRKRLAKEYKHLAILHGDIDFESSQSFEASSIPSPPSTSVHAMKTLTSQETSESEWELL